MHLTRGQELVQLHAMTNLHAICMQSSTGAILPSQQNNIGELFQLLAFLDPGKFGGGIEDVEATYGHLAETKQVCYCSSTNTSTGVPADNS